MRVFIIGTGYSLRNVDLDLLKGEVSIAVNRINLLYDKFSWRPSLYIYEDPKGNPYRDTDMRLHLQEGYPCWYATDTLPWLPNWWKYSNLRIFKRCPHDINNPVSSWHLPHLCAQGGPVYTAAQVAADYSFFVETSEIAFLGTDGYYEKGSDNHLHPEYAPKMMNRSAAGVLNRILPMAHEIIEKECRKRDIKVYNLTEGSVITAHRKLALEEYL